MQQMQKAILKKDDMFYDKDKKEYYCMRCQYTGTEEDVLAKNEIIRFRYRKMMERITDFD